MDMVRTRMHVCGEREKPGGMDEMLTCTHLVEPGSLAIESSIVLPPPSLKAAISRVILSQFFKTLTKFIEKNTKIYSTKLIPLDLSLNIFS